MIDTQSAPSILRRAGMVLLAAGAIDIGFMLWNLSTGAAATYSMTIPAVIAGVLLLRGSLRTATALVWIAGVLLPIAVCSGVLALVRPIDLTLTQLRLAPAATVAAALPLLLFCGVLYWLREQMLRQPVTAAIQAAGRRKPLAHVALGVGVVLALMALMGKQLMRHGDLSDKAVALAQAKHGADFHYYASDITPRSDMEGTFVEAKVLAWRADRVDTVDVFWKEK